MHRNEYGQSRSTASVAVGILAVMLVVLMASFVLPTAQAKDKTEETTQVYQHTYDEVFQAAQAALERMGCPAAVVDKEKGIIQGKGK